MKLQICAILILSLFNLSFVVAQSPIVQSSTFKTKSVTVLDTKFELAEFTLEFDQDLYRINSYTCLPINCSSILPPPSCAPCDYSFGCKQSTVPGCNCDESFCNSTLYGDWIDLEKNGIPVKGTTTVSKPSLYRYFHNDTCSHFSLRLNFRNSQSSLFLARDRIPTRIDHDLYYEGSLNDAFVNVCATNLYNPVGTWFIAVYPANAQIADYELNVKSMLTAYEVSGENCVVPSDLVGTHNCLVDSQPANGTCEDVIQFFVYEVTECGLYYAAVVSPSDLDIYAFVNDNPFPAYLNSSVSHYRRFNDSFGVYICPISPTIPARLYVIADCTVAEVNENGHPYQIVVSSQSERTLWLNKLSEVPAYSVVQLEDTIHLEFPWLDSSLGVGQNWSHCENIDYTCTGFWMMAAQENSNPMYPVTISAQQQFKDMFQKLHQYYMEPTAPINPRQLKFAVLLSITTAIGVQTTFIEHSDISKIVIVSSGTLVSKNGTGITIPPGLTASEVQIECDDSKFQVVLSQIDSFTQSYINADLLPAESKARRFQLESFQFFDGWFACQNRFQSLLQVGTVQTQEWSRVCLIDPNVDLDAFQNDPCCFEYSNWNSVCFPRLHNTTVQTLSLKADISDSCNSQYCSARDLQPYVSYLGEDVDSCSASQDDAVHIAIDQRANMQQCKHLSFPFLESFESSPDPRKLCYSDSDCEFQGRNYSCDIVTRRCLIPFDIVERAFVNCLVNYTDIIQQYYIASKLSIPVTSSNFSSLLYQSLTTSKKDCMSLSPIPSRNLERRTRYQLANPHLDCTDPTQCDLSLICEDDSTCMLQNTICHHYCYDLRWDFYSNNQQECEEELSCNWDENLCIGLTPSECTAACSQGPNSDNSIEFCGVCEDGRQCVDLALLDNSTSLSVIDSSSCNSLSGICFLANNTILVNISQSQCESELSCSNSYAAEHTNCAGYCSDFDYLALFDLTFPDPSTDSTVDGACVVPKTEALNENFFYYFNAYCDWRTQLDIPNGCFEILNMSECQSRGGYWHYPIQNQSECVAQEGCWDVFVEYSNVYLPGTQFWFSPKSQLECLSNYSSRYGASWKSYYEWRPSKLVGGVHRNLNWTERNTFQRNVWSFSLDYPLLSDLFFKAYDDLSAFQSKSSVLCQLGKTKDALSTVACDCGVTPPSDSSQCFSSHDVTPLNQYRVCPRTSVLLTTPSATLSFSNSSVSPLSACVNVLLSEVDVNSYGDTSENQVLLSSNFAKFESTSQEYAIKNDNGAIIGTLLGNGLKTEWAGVSNVRVCLDIDSSITFDSTQFPTYDFASLVDPDILEFEFLEISVILRLSQDIERLGAEAGKRKMKNACSNISKITKSIIAINIISQYFAFFSNITMISSVLVLSVSSFIMQSYLQRLRVPKVVADTEFVSQFLNGFVFFGLIYFAFSASFLLERNQLIFDEVSIGISIYIMNKAPRVGAGVWKLFVERSNVERS